jgi:uncharacterized membrane protein YoaK (UPF0700 family)
MSVTALTRPRDPLVTLLTLLSAATGLVDATSVLGLDKVFTANMTGNVVFLGFAAIGTPGFHWPFYVLALLTFGLGAALSGCLAKRYAPHGRRKWLVMAASGEACLLWLGAGFAALTPPSEHGKWSMYILIALTSAAMGSRNATARQLKVADLTTTVLTLTITGIAADSHLAGGDAPNFWRRMRAVLAMLVGAAVGAYLVRLWGLAPPLALAGLCVVAATLVLAADEIPSENSSVRPR